MNTAPAPFAERLKPESPAYWDGLQLWIESIDGRWTNMSADRAPSVVSSRVSIGYGRYNWIVLPKAERTGRIHAWVIRRGNRYVFVLHRGRRAIVNGRVVTEGDEIALDDEDVISIGRCVMRVALAQYSADGKHLNERSKRNPELLEFLLSTERERSTPLFGALHNFFAWRLRKKRPVVAGEREQEEKQSTRIPAIAQVLADQVRPQRDIVECTVFAPSRVNPKRETTFLVQAFAHVPEDEAIVRAAAFEVDASSKRRGYTTLAMPIERDALLTFHLTLPKLTVREPVQAPLWRGNPLAVSFIVDIPPDMSSKNYAGTLTVSLDQLPVGQINFIITLDSAETSELTEIGVAKLYRKAFVSYASRDRDEVLKRVQMLARLQIDFFQDVTDLLSGQSWQREILAQIDTSDLFLLFWSTAARNSEHVMEEVRYAVSRKGGDDSKPPAILPVIIEGPPPAAPPPELAHLHFDDYLLYFQKRQRILEAPL